jgi:hypothetical protein
MKFKEFLNGPSEQLDEGIKEKMASMLMNLMSKSGTVDDATSFAVIAIDKTLKKHGEDKGSKLVKQFVNGLGDKKLKAALTKYLSSHYGIE